MKANQDAYGKQLLAQYNHQTPLAEIIERDGDYIDTGSVAGLYLTEYDEGRRSNAAPSNLRRAEF